MKKVITYGTYDLLHQGHVNLLRRAKELGDYLIVGVTADGFDWARGKINVQQSLMERIEAVKATGYADQIIVEEYEGQKIDDIKRYGVDIFAIGSDWQGVFDYLNEFCKVVYLPRTQGISSSELRAEKNNLRMGLLGNSQFLSKFERESHHVNGLDIVAICTSDNNIPRLSENLQKLENVTSDYNEMLSHVDAVYIISKPEQHYLQIKKALMMGKHVLCESPIVLSSSEYEELKAIAKSHHCILMDALRTAYSTAYSRLKVLAKSDVIGKIKSVDCSCTSLRDQEATNEERKHLWNSICSWGPNALLPIFQLLGTQYTHKYITSHIIDEDTMYDDFTKVAFVYPEAVASIKVGKGVKSEGELIVSGTKGYIYVPAPWWKTDYFEIRREDATKNKRYFYQLDGEGIRYELVSFVKAIQTGREYSYISNEVSEAIIKVLESYYKKEDFLNI